MVVIQIFIAIRLNFMDSDVEYFSNDASKKLFRAPDNTDIDYIQKTVKI